MSSFWATSDGEVIGGDSGEFDGGGGGMDVIPDGTALMAFIDEAKVETLETGERYISLRWSAAKPTTYKNRKVFQKLWVFDLNPRTADKDKAKKKRDKDKRMLAAIDQNAGGKLRESGTDPTTISLTSGVTNKFMMIKVFVWSMKNAQTGETMEGNWVGYVAPKSAYDAAAVEDEPVKVTKAAPKAASIDDEIPF